MAERPGNDTLKAACAALRRAVTTRSGGDVPTMRLTFHAIAGLEQASLNAPQNRGWVRQRQIELREALDGIAKAAPVVPTADDLKRIYGEIVAIVQRTAV